MTTSSRPIAADPTASHRPSPVTRVIETPNSANSRPSSAPESSRSTTGSSGDREVRMKRHQLPRPLAGVASCTAVRSDKPSMTMAASSTTIGTHCHDSIGCGSWNFSHASNSANSPPRVNSTIATMKA